MIARRHNAQPQAADTVRLRQALDDAEIFVAVQNLLLNQSFVLVREIDKALVDNQPNIFRRRPINQPNQLALGNEIARRVIGVDDDQRGYLFVAEKVRQVVDIIREVFILRREVNRLGFIVAVGIFFKGRAHKADFPRQLLHEQLNQLRRAVADQDIFCVHSEIFSRQQRINSHARRILRQEIFRVGCNFVKQLLRREVGINQITKINQLGITPITAVTPLNQREFLVIVGREHRLGNIQILNIVNLVPAQRFFAAAQSIQTLGANLRLVKNHDDAQNLFIILIVAQSL